MNLKELQKEIHENAKAHGWWEKEVPIEERLFLCISELAEAGEEIRNGHDPKEIYYSGAPGQQIELGGIDKLKPEGYPIELADCAIRLIDFAAGYKKELCDIDLAVQLELARKHLECYSELHNLDSIFGVLAEVSDQIIGLKNSIYSLDIESDFWINDVHFPLAIMFVDCQKRSIDIQEAIRIKMRYNRGRAYRHGGKVA